MPFEMLHDRTFDAAGRFKRLLLPNIAALSTEQCAQIRGFVENGGSVLATYKTSLYDENGERHSDFGGVDIWVYTGPNRRGRPKLALLDRKEERVRFLLAITLLFPWASAFAQLTQPAVLAAQ